MLAAHSGGLDILVLSIYFQKSKIGWLQQPPTERMPKFNLLNYFFFKHQDKIIFDLSLNY
jgi:hypothetical protein